MSSFGDCYGRLHPEDVKTEYTDQRRLSYNACVKHRRCEITISVCGINSVGPPTPPYIRLCDINDSAGYGPASRLEMGRLDLFRSCLCPGKEYQSTLINPNRQNKTGCLFSSQRSSQDQPPTTPQPTTHPQPPTPAAAPPRPLARTCRCGVAGRWPLPQSYPPPPLPSSVRCHQRLRQGPRLTCDTARHHRRRLPGG